jgi:hypothetical protein
MLQYLNCPTCETGEWWLWKVPQECPVCGNKRMVGDPDLYKELKRARARGKKVMENIVLPKQSDYPDLFEQFGHPVSVYRFLVQHHPEFGGLTGEEAYKQLSKKLIIDCVEGILRGDFT